MEDYSWILANNINGDVIRVRQRKAFGDIFVDEKGNEYLSRHLDLTEAHFEFPMDDFKSKIEERNKRFFEEQQAEHQELMNKMLSSMDANAIVDHKAKIDERGDILLGLLTMNGQMNPIDKILEMTEQCFTAVYNQDKDFFKGK